MNNEYGLHLHDPRETIALRMIDFEARTYLIRHCTGLSDDHIRRLYKDCVSRERKLAIKRRRGKSPRQLAYFTRNPAAQFEASMLAAVLVNFGLLKHLKYFSEHPLQYADRFCDAYAEYRNPGRSGSLSFEHAWYLRQALVSGSDLCLDRCPDCAGFYVSDVLTFAARACPLCLLSSRPLALQNSSAPNYPPVSAALASPRP